MYAYSAKEGPPLLGRASFVVTGPVKVLSACACGEKVQTVRESGDPKNLPCQ